MPATDEPEPRFRGNAEFEFDLASPLFEQMRDLLEAVAPVPLVEANIALIQARPGVYMLIHQGVPVYIGKADESVPLRLGRHRVSLSGRRGLAVEDIAFKSITFAATWNPFLPESHLIEHYRTAESHGWNGKGFGSNEPGVNRGGTHLKADNFYKRFPLQDDWVCNNVRAGTMPSTLELLRAIKRVPFYFKFQGNRVEGDANQRRRAIEAQRDYESTTITVPRDNMTARELLVLVASQLPGSWQATITPSHMLLYKEVNVRYPDMEVVWPPALTNSGSTAHADPEDSR